MKISEFVGKHQDLGIRYHTIHRLIREKALKENIHYRRSFRGNYEKYELIEAPLIKFLQGGDK